MDPFVHDITTGPPPNMPVVDMVYADVPYGTGRKFKDYDDTVSVATPVQQGVVDAARALLRPGGILTIQCDHHMNYRIRSMLEAQQDLVFVNEIIWSYNSGGAGSNYVPHKHDTIYVFAKRGASYTFNVVREPYPRDYGNRAGFHPEGRHVTSVWNIPILSTTSSERTGYATEKPPALIARLLEIYSNRGDTLYDPCCGSGASAAAAQTMGRNYILSDINPTAVAIASRRLENQPLW